MPLAGSRRVATRTAPSIRRSPVTSSRTRWLLLCGLGVLALAACNPDDVVHKVGWFSTMRHQRSVKPYARPMAPVDGTVPVTGAEPPVDLNTADRLVNARTRTSESLNHGQ